MDSLEQYWGSRVEKVVNEAIKNNLIDINGKTLVFFDKNDLSQLVMRVREATLKEIQEIMKEKA